MSNMECTRTFCIVISCILLTAKCVNSQYRYNNDQYKYTDPAYIHYEGPTYNRNIPSYLTPQPIQTEAANQQSLANYWQPTRKQPLSEQWQTTSQRQSPNQWQSASLQPLSSQWNSANQQPFSSQWQSANKQPSTTEKPTTKQPSFQPTRNQEPTYISAYARATAPVHFGDTAKSLAEFSINLMKEVIRGVPGNTVVSPYSIATLLSLLQQGANDATLEQLTGALHMDQYTSASAYKAHIDDIQNRKSNNTLKTACNIYLANEFNLNTEYRAAALRDFHSDVTRADFAQSAQITREINHWVANNTDNKIQNLIPSGTININTQMVLVNAVYFKGLWEVPFRRQSTFNGDFLLSNGVIKQVTYMMTRRQFKTGTDSYTAAKVVVVPFELSEYFLMVILPNSLSNVADTLATLTPERLEEYMNFRHLETKLELPKFSIKADTDLAPVLKRMGITKLFADSDLSSIGTSLANKSPEVSTAVHSAALTIDEEGGSASAATAFAAVALSNDGSSVTFTANRPFLAVLWDGKSKLPLFVAKIEDPTL